jgi:hypothetical protein
MSTSALPLPRATDVRLPRVARTALLLFLWLLPFHSLIIALLFGYFGVAVDTVRALAAWKEIAIVVLVAWVALRSLSGAGPRVELMAPDVAVTALIAIAVVFALLQNPLFFARIPGAAVLYGFRDSILFMLLYYVGRSTPEIAETDTILRHAYLIALVVSVIGILERIFVSPDMLVVLGVASYMNDFLGLSAYTAGNEWGLPQDYWSILGGIWVHRSGSVFLHSQGFAVPFLFLMPAATAWILIRRGKHPWLARIGYAILWAGLLVTITRMTTIVCILQVVIFYLIFRRPEWSLGTIAAVIAVGAVTVIVVPGLLHFAWETLSWQTGSSTSHLKDWQQGLLAFFERPWGNGLGTTDAAPLKSLREPLTADNMYLTYAVQLGVAGIVAFVAVLATIFATAWRVAWANVSDVQRRVAAVVALTTIGIIINGLTSFVFSSNLLAYVFFWVAGAMVTGAERLRYARAKDAAL